MTPQVSIPKILVAVDFSAESDHAVRHAIALGRVRGAEVLLLHACSVVDVRDEERRLVVAKRYLDRLDEELGANRTRLEELRGRFAGQGVVVSHAVADGFPDTTIVKIAEEVGARTIVLGTHGRTGLKWFFLGSVAQRVVRLARSEVLVARGDAPAGGYRRILVATDFSPSADRALARSLDFAANDARIDLVHCWHIPTIGLAAGMPLVQGMVGEDRVALEASLRASGEELVARHRRSGLDLRFRAVFAPPRPGLLDELEGGAYDLVALGSHGRRALPRFMLGSVAEAIVARAPCSALVVHDE
jgi:nucleotide-binding universal stress UspA family protein